MQQVELIKLLEELIAITEEQPWVEFKLNKGSISNNEIGEYISALSNGATISNKDFAYLVWGIANKTRIVTGTNFHFSRAKEGNQDLELWLRHLLHPKITFEVFDFDCSGNHIVLLRIPAARGEPTHFKKIPYIRINSQKTDLRNFPDYIRMIYNTLDDWSAAVVQGASLSDLHPEAIASGSNSYCKTEVF